ncbi:hypothetical protein ACFT9J_35700 [Streptomyces anthocyanicus]|uniref:hypothetical protein n=1 Tax=Streptomyces anthocyanicus TaxID=68174 RepID=UPI00362BDB33
MLSRLRDLADQQLRSRPAEYDRVFGDLLALAGQYHWSAALENFADDFYTVACPHCGAEVTIAIGDYGFYSAIRDWDRGDVERRELLPTQVEELPDPGRWMHATAVRDRQQRIAEGITDLECVMSSWWLASEAGAGESAVEDVGAVLELA